MRHPGWHLAWAAVYAANLVIPLLFGWDVTAEGGRAGMLAAVVLVWLTGHLVVDRWHGPRVVLVFGGGCTALSQLVPFLQIVAGLAGLNAASHRYDEGLSEVGGFVVTLVTGGLLLVAAAGCGLFFRACFLAAEVGADVEPPRPPTGSV